MLKEFMNKLMNRKKKFDEMKDEQRMIEKLQERKKSANERELERYMEEDRQEMIKMKLKEYRQRKQDEFWHKDTISQDFMFKGERRPLKTQGTILTKANLKGGGI